MTEIRTTLETTKPVIRFSTRAGAVIEGTVMEDYGHALLIAVSKTNRKNLRGRTIVAPKNDMANGTMV